MSEVISVKREDWDRLEERARRLAQEKSSLQLVNHLMNSLSEVPGLERTAEAIVRVILDNLGGANVALYYVVGAQTHYTDAYGERRLIATVEDGLVRRAFAERALVEETRDFADTKMATPEFTKAAFWALPLIAGEQLVGVLKMEGMLLTAADVRRQLQPFFNYTALVLRNEIESFLKFTEAAQLAAIVQSSEDAIIGKTLEGIITSWNKGAEHIYGYTAQEVLGRSIAVLTPPGRGDEVPQILARLTEGKLVERFETVRRRKDGQIIHVSLTISPIRNVTGRIVGASTIARDITEKKRVEDSLRRLNRELRAISDCNQTLLRAVDEQSLLNDICRIVCEEAGYRMAWVGYAEHDEARTIRAVAWAGTEDGYLAAANVTWADTERGHGPTGSAIRTGRSACVQNFATDPQASLWRETARQRGYHSSIALPLMDEDGVPFGALSIYSSEPNAFTADEVRLLEELAGDLAYGINALRTRAEHKRAEVALRESERKYRVVAENTYDWEFWTDPQGRFLYSSPSCLRVTGHTQEEFLTDPTTLERIIHPDDRTSYVEHEREIRTSTRPGEIDFRVILPDGSERWIGHVCQVVFDEQDVQLGRRGSNRDITERKQAEVERQAHLRLLQSMDRVNRAIQGSDDLEQMMGEVLDVTLAIFNCDRAWLVYPCDPTAAFFQVPMERTRPEFPGALAMRVDVPVDADIVKLFEAMKASSGPLQFGPASQHPLPAEMAKRFNIQSQILLLICPKVDSPYIFGLHQCSRPRVWTPEEERLLQEVGRRLGDALTSLLVHRNLRESEQRFRLVFENSPVSIGEEDYSRVKTLFDGLRKDGVTDIENYFDQHPESVGHCAELVRLVDVNRAALTLHAADNKQELLANLVKTFTPESLAVFRQGLVCLWNGGTEMRSDAVVKTLAGEPRHVTVYFSVCPGYEQSLARVLVSLADITERKRAEEALRRSEAGLQLALEAGQLGDWHWSIVTGEIVWSARCKALYGLPPGEPVTYERFLATLHPDDRKRTAAALKRAVETRADYELEKRVLWPDGSVHWTASRGRVFRDAVGRPLNMAGVTMDVTERKQVEATREALLTLEARLSEASTPVEAARIIFATADQLWDWDCGALELYSPEEDRADSILNVDVIEGRRCEVRSPLPRGAPSPRTRRVLQDGPELILRTPPIERPVDSIMFGDTGRPSASIMCVPLRQKGKPVGVLSVQSYTLNAFTRDDLRTLQGLADHWGGALERIRATAALRESEARYRELILHQGEGLGIVDPEERITFTNPAGEIIFGVPSGGLVGHSLREFTTDAEYARLLAQTTKRRAGEKSTYELEIIRPDGETRCLFVSAVPQTNAAGQFAGTLGLFLDITDRKRAEASLLKLNQELDQRVKERTAELEIKNKELERVNKLFVGRELRMVELKARIKALETQLPPAAPTTGSPP